MLGSKNPKINENILDGLNIPDNIRNSYEDDLKGYAKQLNEVADSGKKASADIDGFNNYLAKNGKQTIKSTTVMQDFKNGIKSVGKTALSMATNVGIDLLIGGAINLGAWGIISWQVGRLELLLQIILYQHRA